MSLNQTEIMGIINLTDDSFYGASRVSGDGVVGRAEQMIGEGADIIDLGGCSTRPGAVEVGEEQEWQRVASALEALADCECRVSVDTFRAGVARRALQLRPGLIINDISGGSEEMFDVVGDADATYVLTHSVAGAKGATVVADDEQIVSRVCRYFEQRVKELQDKNVKTIILDVGIGFSGGIANDFRLLGGLSELSRFGLPLLVGLSRKRLVWQTLGVSADDALSGSLALSWQALMGGATMLRTHDVAATKDMIRLFERYKEFNQ